MKDKGIHGCCGDRIIVDFSKMSLPFELPVDYGDGNLWISMATIVFNPLFWNVVARWEYHTHKLTQMAGSAKLGCIVLGITIFLLGVFRDWRYKMMLETQPRSIMLHENWILYLGYLCLVCGTLLTLSSFWRLGFYGTFLGDYFGILQKEKVTGFPFNIVDNPMYIGSTLNFLGFALLKACPCGIVHTILVGLVYKVALLFEEPYTAFIYDKKTTEKAKKL
ncbi:phosphatidylethanolamine N-methyltransferase-like [Gigantopelta aegis]|uniref:phosphatidylethanolamine N-methyltransferase-like n=1 Tax=Gigantopelta aegis TaxID=1735272 RepID=UPI001B88AA9B|nr:phosphatidylethanolamine N-methyltransferase-like [Gigantopelta aegis]